ncbi:MAG: hypothetical protein IOC86_04305 [Aestuariivirga sp.]|nr:hypothetical protein [Aestuariivirga sp.]
MEYVLWGIPPGGKHEELLVSEAAGIRDAAHAERIKATLTADHGCTRVRVQALAPLTDGREVLRMFARSVNV